MRVAGQEFRDEDLGLGVYGEGCRVPGLGSWCSKSACNVGSLHVDKMPMRRFGANREF